MSNYSVADAKNNLSRLIKKALSGEGVTITRHGQPVVELRPVVAHQSRLITSADLDWIARRRKGRRSREGAGEFVSRMRDEEWK
jgi:prevent-host-death family protein